MRALIAASFAAVAVVLTPAVANAYPVIDEPPVDHGVFDDPCAYADCDGMGVHLPAWLPFRPLVELAYEVTR